MPTCPDLQIKITVTTPDELEKLITLLRAYKEIAQQLAAIEPPPAPQITINPTIYPQPSPWQSYPWQNPIIYQPSPYQQGVPYSPNYFSGIGSSVVGGALPPKAIDCMTDADDKAVSYSVKVTS